MEFKELIAAFAAKYGIGHLDGSDGAVELDVDGTRVELLGDSHAGNLVACIEIGHPEPNASEKLATMMLKANFLLRATDGATLCQNPENDSYAIVRVFPLALTDVATLAAGLESLVNQTENWRKALAGMHEAESARATTPGLEDSHHDMVSNGYFHV